VRKGGGTGPCSLVQGSLGYEACTLLNGSAFYTRQLLDKTKVLTAFRGGEGEGEMLKNLILGW